MTEFAKEQRRLDIEERDRKQRVLFHLQCALHIAGKHIDLVLLKDVKDEEMVAVYDTANNRTKYVNVTGDSASAMIIDIYRQAGGLLI